MTAITDIKPRVPSIFEPGQAYDEFEQSTEEPEKTSEEEKDNQLEEMFDHLAQRNFVARRGRNNRILLKPILENVFKDKTSEEAEKAQIKGQNYYLEKYRKCWLAKRDKSGAALDNKPRKRAKRSNFEICVEEFPHLKDYAYQRNLAVDQGNSRMAKNAVKVAECDLKSILTQSSAHLMAQNQASTTRQEGVYSNLRGGSLDSQGMEEEEEEAQIFVQHASLHDDLAKLAAHEFVVRKH